MGFSQQPDQPVIWLSLDKINVDEKTHLRTVEDQISRRIDTVTGTYVALKNGVKGEALLLDGYSAYITSQNVPVISGSFTVEGWIAIGAYPTNFCPVAEQGGLEGKGYSLGINHEGKPGFKIATRNGWVSVEGTAKIPLLQWAHICGVFDTRNISLFLNGEKIATKEVQSDYVPAKDERILYGITGRKFVPESSIDLVGTVPVNIFFDGLFDEIKIWDRALTEKDLNIVKNEKSILITPALEKRPLPKLPDLKFGAVYANLKFYESWDNYWRISGLPDIVVSFDQLDGHFVFWRGTSYIPHWVTENGIWYDNEFNETWSENGCHEPMSDKRCEHSQVKIVENSPARCVIQWRYALIDNLYIKSNVDSITGQGDWTDEIYTIYPDGTAIRSQTLHSSNLSSRFEWHEGIIVMGQGQRPEDVLLPEALVMANMNGEEHIYSWELKGPDVQKPGTTYVRNKKDKWLTELPGANIHLVNTNSLFKPYVIINPDDKPVWDYFHTSHRPDISIFPWWNHWPTAFKPSDGRYALDSDRASHSSISHVREWKAYKKTEYSETRLMLVGLTKEKASDLVPLAKSWSSPPEITVKGENIISKGYELSEKAYQLECTNNNDRDEFTIEMNCTSDKPSVNPAFLVSNCNKEEIVIKINNKKLTSGKDFSYGFVDSANGPNLIIWINRKFDRVTRISVLMD